MEYSDLHSKTKDELIDIIKNLSSSKGVNTSEDHANKRKRETLSEWSPGRAASCPVEFDNNHNVGTMATSSFDHSPIIAQRNKLPSAEDQLRFAKVLVEEMYQFCSLLDVNGNILLTNAPALRGAGVSLIDVVGRPFWEARWWQTSPDNQVTLKRALEEAKAGKFVRYETLVYGDAKGQAVIWVDFSLVGVYEPGRNGPQLRYLLAEGRNISDKKKAEDALERKNEELRNLYEKVTELDELKSQFFANMSHELRTPLTLILGPVQRMLNDATLPQRDLQDLEVVKRNTQVLLKHVNDLLDVSKIEAKKMDMHVERIDLEKLLKLICSNFDLMASERNIQYTVNCSNIANLGNFLVEVDSDKIQRIILNLLSNAFKFTPIGGIVNVQLLMEDKKDGKGVVKLVLSDSGPGVPENLRNVIFERFRQGEGASNRKFGGTGLGLAIAKEFVEMHKGKIFVEESQFHGAKFVVELPIAQPDHEVAQVQVPVKVSKTMTQNTIADLTGNIMTADKFQTISNNAQLASQPAAKLVDTNITSNRPTILVVEDNIDMGNFISDNLSDNYRIMRAYNGVQGLEVISQFKPDLILCDVMMPYMSGDVMIQHVRAQKELDSIPIIMLTAKADDNLKIQSLKSGVQDFLNKPFSIEELKARVDNLITVKLAVDALQQDLETKDRNLMELTNQLLTKRRELAKLLDIAEKARKEAETLSTIKDEFLMTLSHELRTPLTGIIGWVSLIKEEVSSPESLDINEVKRGLEIIEQCAEAETKITTDILDLSDIIAGRLKLARNAINISQLIDTGLESLSVAAAAKNITIRKYDTRNSRSDLFLMGDFEKLVQVVYNLIGNSVKFTPRGGHIEIGAEYSSEVNISPSATLVTSHKVGSIEGTSVIIRVKDDGVGICTENLEKLFARFGQLDSSTTRTYPGLGLGLALCRHIIELHGGFITAESSGSSKGTLVSVYLPLVPATSPTTFELPKIMPVPTKAVKVAILNSVKVLIVEPEKPSQLLLETIFRREGASAESTSGINHALNVVNMTGVPNLVIVNVDKTPEKDILWLMKTLLVMKREIPFIGLVSQIQHCDVTEIRKAGMEFVRKPFKPAEVIASSVSLLSRVPKL